MSNNRTPVNLHSGISDSTALGHLLEVVETLPVLSEDFETIFKSLPDSPDFENIRFRIIAIHLNHVEMSKVAHRLRIQGLRLPTHSRHI